MKINFSAYSKLMKILRMLYYINNLITQKIRLTNTYRQKTNAIITFILPKLSFLQLIKKKLENSKLLKLSHPNYDFCLKFNSIYHPVNRIFRETFQILGIFRNINLYRDKQLQASKHLHEDFFIYSF